MTIHDYFAAHSYLDSFDHIQRKVIDYLVGGQSPPEEYAWLSAIKDPASKVEMLALAQLSIKSYAQSGDPREKSGGIRSAVSGLNNSFQKRLDDRLKPLGLTPALPALDELPELSFAIHFRFKLRQPYISHDESALYLLDNPVRKEKVFRLPYIAPTQWKGVLHAVMACQLAARWENELLTAEGKKEFLRQRARLFALFGTEKAFELGAKNQKKSAEKMKARNLYLDQFLPGQDSEWQAQKYRRYIRRYFTGNGFLAGRLQFYPSFFTQLGLEVMNPHSRKTGAGELPILFECVPKGAEADFALLYVPHDCVGQPVEATRKQVAADVKLIARGLSDMFCLYGFGAKTTSGFGRAEERVEGKIALRARGLVLPKADDSGSQPVDSAPLPKYLEAPDRLKPEYLNPDGAFKERPEAELKKMGKMARWEYDKARKWWLAQAEKTKEAATESEPEETWPEAAFKNFGELEKVAEGIADALRQGDAA
jgi:CRISPR-associated protein Cmr2